MKKMIFIILAVLLGLTSCEGSHPVAHHNRAVTGMSVVKRVRHYPESMGYAAMILLENDIWFNPSIDGHSVFINACDSQGCFNHEYDFLFVEPGDTIQYENGKIIEIRFKD